MGPYSGKAHSPAEGVTLHVKPLTEGLTNLKKIDINNVSLCFDQHDYPRNFFMNNRQD
jgi:hypothetical protein